MTNPTAPKTVLLVDDEEDIRQVVHMMLTREGFQVLQASNGMEAFSILTSGQSVDLVICDVIMPLLRGNELLSLLQKSGNSVPIIVISGHFSSSNEDETQIASTEEVSQALNKVRELISNPPKGISPGAFLQKPFTRRQLVELILGLLPQEKLAA